MSKVWFITGANRGFGRVWAEAALERGDRVAATSRQPEALQDLVTQFRDAVLPLRLDVTDRAAAIAAVGQAAKTFGGLDVVVNNAGYGLFGAVEEVTEQQVRDQLEVNFFGVLNVTQAVLPILRKQGHGHIIQVSSIGGLMSYPNLGAYHASKWAVEGLTESLAQEVAPFGIKVTLVEPGGYATDWGRGSAVHANPAPQYDPLRRGQADIWANLPAEFIGEPTATGPAILQVVDAAEPPTRIFFGLTPTKTIVDIYAKRLQTWKDWEAVSIAANGH
ncbi:SDR family NAD(P)-dependent oxidoreductase [Mesorhizobium sp. M0189]|uniref:SDR family NAD(P)-dependent oxidoreductase n=1 Tax=unclassified Mesorhizobium TaxID=325217 RepID=UPI0033351657